MNRLPSEMLRALTARLTTGWNTFHTRSVISHVFLPDGIALSLGLKQYADGRHRGEALIGRQGKDEEQVVAGPRTWTGAYTELEVLWRGVRVRVQASATGGMLQVQVTPLVTYPSSELPKTPILTAHLEILWNRLGTIPTATEARGATHVVRLQTNTTAVADPYVPLSGPYLCLPLDRPVLIEARAAEIRDASPDHDDPHDIGFPSDLASNLEQVASEFGDSADAYRAVQRVLAWDTIYDPQNDRVISPVSRIWNNNNGGYVLFDWDTYFAALLAAVDNEDLAYANAIAITEEITERGFIPNVAAASGFVSRDRSQPPVGSLTVLWLYQRFGKTWILDYLFERLLRWNRWWEHNREYRGYLCWGSNPYAPVTGNRWETDGVGGRFGGALESGLDNSPMYDEIPFNPNRNVLELGDVGLMSLYITDCRVLGRLGHTVNLTRRSGISRSKLLARPYLGADELPGVPRPLPLRPSGGARAARREVGITFDERVADARLRVRELQRRLRKRHRSPQLRPILSLGRPARSHRPHRGRTLPDAPAARVGGRPGHATPRMPRPPRQLSLARSQRAIGSLAPRPRRPSR